ncbi:ran-binding protein 10-like [Chenopodium quinoa]|uniref:ran-binding protein 10-like n=1 Tax=Chenopodium quinoa TaxID=63459 RepID=UPI000B797A4A|nr:ran-binding protein 10-like [Chenopodium quinoa]
MVANQQEQISNYFLEQAKLSASSSEELDNENEAIPTELNTINSSGGFLVVSTDKLSVEYTGVNLHGHDVGVIQANHPAPVKRLMYYFEMKVINAGAKGQIAIGFTTDSFKMRRQPGWEANSYGYHGDDGLLYRGHGKGETFGPSFTTGDTVGGGINYASQEVFFTKNGIVVGTVYKDVKSQLFPTVAVHSQREEVIVNFGKEPFLFDIKAYEAQERLKQQSMIEKISLPQNVSYGIVRSYLLHYGYEDTLNVFDMATSTSIPPISLSQQNGFIEQDDMYALNQRKTLRQLIRTGKIDAAFDKLRDWYPQTILDDNSPICFLLHSQKFIELVRVGKLEDAVKYGRVELAKFFGQEEYKELVRECVALLAYEEPLNSPVGHLLKESQREVVADAVNAMILSTNPGLKDSLSCLHSQLEKLLRQLSACCLERRSLNGDQGEAFHLHRVLTSSKMEKH